MPNLVPHLSAANWKGLLADLNYLNTGEFRSFCTAHCIPYRIWVETADGNKRLTKEADRKPIVLGRIRHYLRTGHVGKATCFAAKVVALAEPPNKFKSSDRLLYGWYNKKNESLLASLRDLTHGRFKDGAMARVLMMKFWTEGKAPTLAAFAKAWMKASQQVDLLTPEYAYLTDLRKNKAGMDWKAVRASKARKVMKILRAIPTP